MSRTQTMSLSQFMKTYNGYWKTQRGDPALGVETARLWLAELSDIPAPRLMEAMRRLARSNKWPPSLSELIASATPAASYLNASEVYRKLRAAANIHGPRAGKMVSPGLNAIAKEAGDWPAIRNWRSEGEPFDTQRVAKAIEAVCDVGRIDIMAPGALALEGPKDPALTSARGIVADVAKKVGLV